MNRRLSLLALALFLLTGCSAGPEPTVPTNEPMSATAPAPAEPTVCYDPDHTLEEISQGALTLYPLSRTECTAIIPFGDDLLLASGQEKTTLSVLSSTMHISAVAALDCFIDSESPAFLVNEQGVTYFDQATHSLVLLDASLKEVNRITLPEEILGDPCISHDRKTLYYASGDEIRAIDLESGLDRLLRQMTSPDYALVNIHLEDSLLECVLYEGTVGRGLFIDTQTGQTIQERERYAPLWTCAGRFFTTHMDGAYREVLTGSADTPVSALQLRELNCQLFPILNRNGLVTYGASESGSLLEYYDLTTGTRTATLTLEHMEDPRSIRAVPDSGCIWFLGFDSTYGCDVLYCWDLAKAEPEDSQVYLSARYSADAPDLSGLERCRESAAALSEKHGVEILLWQDAAVYQPRDYSFVPEHQVPLLEHNLAVLDAALSHFPDEFLKKTASGAGCDKIRICLLREIQGNPEAGVLDSVLGLQFRDEDDIACIAVTLDSTMEQILYHELFHIMEIRILSRSNALDNWNQLNPEGFDYDYDYVKNLSRENTGLVSGENRAFVDLYSMSFPKEDRARIMEYAMMPDCESIFESDTMQQKLQQICIGIRDAFRLKKSPEVFRWEQYLKQPLTNP